MVESIATRSVIRLSRCTLESIEETDQFVCVLYQQCTDDAHDQHVADSEGRYEFLEHTSTRTTGKRGDHEREFPTWNHTNTDAE